MKLKNILKNFFLFMVLILAAGIVYIAVKAPQTEWHYELKGFGNEIDAFSLDNHQHPMTIKYKIKGKLENRMELIVGFSEKKPNDKDNYWLANHKDTLEIGNVDLSVHMPYYATQVRFVFLPLTKNPTDSEGTPDKKGNLSLDVEIH